MVLQKFKRFKSKRQLRKDIKELQELLTASQTVVIIANNWEGAKNGKDRMFPFGVPDNFKVDYLLPERGARELGKFYHRPLVVNLTHSDKEQWGRDAVNHLRLYYVKEEKG